MADEFDEEFRAAIRPFARVLAPPEFLAEHGDNEEAFEQLVEFFCKSTVGKMARHFHDQHGRYPEFEEVFHPEMRKATWTTSPNIR